MTLHITAVGICIATTLVFGLLCFLNAMVEYGKPYLSEFVRWRNVVLNLGFSVFFLTIGWMAL